MEATWSMETTSSTFRQRLLYFCHLSSQATRRCTSHPWSMVFLGLFSRQSWCSSTKMPALTTSTASLTGHSSTNVSTSTTTATTLLPPSLPPPCTRQSSWRTRRSWLRPSSLCQSTLVSFVIIIFWRRGSNSKSIIFKLIIENSRLGICCEIALGWKPENLTN